MDDSNREEFLAKGVSWLLEMEVLRSPDVHNFLYLNIFNSSKHITDVDYLIDEYSKCMLIFVSLSWFGRTFRKFKQVEVQILENLNRVLPSFRFRVIFDRHIFDLALKRAQEIADKRDKE